MIYDKELYILNTFLAKRKLIMNINIEKDQAVICLIYCCYAETLRIYPIQNKKLYHSKALGV
jgi:hypothetical protein